MPGTVTTFHLDLMRIPCFIPAKGTGTSISIRGEIQNLPVEITLRSEQSPGTKKPDEDQRRYFYNKISITITKADEHLNEHDFIEGRARFLLMEYQQIVVEAINRLIRYFKYTKRHPNLREVSFIDLLDQEHEYCNPDWETTDGERIVVSAEPVKSGVITIPGLGFLQDDFFGIVAIADQDAPELQKHFLEQQPTRLSDQLLSDAQSAALINNTRRAVLELAIAIEVFVKSAFFKQEKVAGAAFEYLEDKGRETIKVIELLDAASMYAFGESFKTVSPEDYRHIDHVFRCRNKVAHRGETKFRDDSGAWHEPDHETLKSWWSATLRMFAWVEKKLSHTKTSASQGHEP